MVAWRRWAQLWAMEPLHVVEVLPAHAEGRRRGAVRYLYGTLPGIEAHPPLEDHAPANGRVVPAVAADDQRVLWTLMAEVTEATPPSLERPGIRAWQLSGAAQKRAQAFLEDAQLRPLAPVAAGARVAVVPLSDPALRLRPLHRGIRGLATFQLDTFLHLVAGYVRVYELDAGLETEAGRTAAIERLASLATGNHAVLLVLPGRKGKILRVRQALELANIRAVPRSPTLRSLDLALLNALLLQTVLGIQSPDAPDHPNVQVTDSMEQLISDVDSGALQVGFVLNPPPAWEVRAVMEAREQLPARTFLLDPAPAHDLAP